MTTLVTGAAGHLGNALVRALVHRGERVRALIHSQAATPPRPRALAGLDVEVVGGDLRDGDSLERATRGCRRVFHTAALISIRDGDRRALWDVNVDGTARLLAAARRAGVERVVHTSSFGAVGARSDRPSNEADELSPFEPATDYERSKAAAEHVVLRQVVDGQDVVMVNPSATVGPFDFGPSLVGRTIVDFGLGRMRAYVAGGFDWVPLEDVVHGHLAAMDRGRSGQRYLLTGQYATIDQVLDWLADATGVPRPRLAIPAGLLATTSVLTDWLARRLAPARAPRFNRHSIRLLALGKRGDHTRARDELGFSPSSVERAFHAAVEWFRAEGVLPLKRTRVG